MPIQPDEQNRLRLRARPWRRLTVLGGLALAASFFLPALRSCGPDLVPFLVCGQIAADIAEGIRLRECFEHALLICAFVPAYLAGLILAAAAWARICGVFQANRVLTRFLLVVFAGAAAIVLSSTCYLSILEGIPDLGDLSVWLVFFVGPIAVLAYLIRARKTAELFPLALAFIGSLWMFCWFAGWLWFSFNDVLYGVWLSCAAAALLLVGVVGETRALTSRGWRKIIGQLLIARPVRLDDARGRCPRCEYLLRGLKEMRCPECGRPFTFDELNASPEELDFQSDPLVSNPVAPPPSAV